MKIKVSVSTGYCGSEKERTLEFDDEEFEDMTEEEKIDHINNVAFEYMVCEMIDWSWGEVY